MNRSLSCQRLQFSPGINHQSSNDNKKYRMNALARSQKALKILKKENSQNCSNQRDHDWNPCVLPQDMVPHAAHRSVSCTKAIALLRSSLRSCHCCISESVSDPWWYVVCLNLQHIIQFESEKQDLGFSLAALLFLNRII